MRNLILAFSLLILAFGISIPLDAQFVQGPSVINVQYEGNWSATRADYGGGMVVRGSDGFAYIATEDNIPAGQNPVGNNRYWGRWGSAQIIRGATGGQGNPGADGDGYTFYYVESELRPNPSGESYTNGTFVGPNGWSNTIPAVHTHPIWVAAYDLEGDGSTYHRRGVGQLTGRDGRVGNTGAIGPIGLTGRAGRDAAPAVDGTDGNSSDFVFRKTINVEITTAPTITYDGTNLTLPSDDNNAWQEDNYISRIHASYPLDSRNSNPQGIDRDESGGTAIDYVLDRTPDVNGDRWVYRYNSTTGAFIDRWRLHSSNVAPIDIDVRNTTVRVLDGGVQGSPGNEFYQIFAYDKGTGSRKSGEEFTIPRPGTDPLRGISTDGTHIYIITTGGIRKFSFAGVEVQPAPLTGLGDNQNPQGVAANSYYLMTLDLTDRKVYTRDIDALAVRYQTKEFGLGTENDNPIGVALTETEVLILNQNSSDPNRSHRVFRYFNPDQPLWVAMMRKSEESPYTVEVQDPVTMEGIRGESDVVIQGTGIGQNGQDGRGIDALYQEVTTGTMPATPSGGTIADGIFTVPPPNWHLTESEAKSAFSGDGDFFVSIVKMNRNQTSARHYGLPIKLTGDVGRQGERGRDGAASQAGNSSGTIYRKATSIPAKPTDGTGTYVNGVFTSPSADWSVDPPTPGSLAANEEIYFVPMVLPGQGTDNGGRIIYRTVGQLARGPPGAQGEASTVPGPDGADGNSTDIIYTRSATVPTIPADGTGTWNGSDYDPPSPWFEDIPPGDHPAYKVDVKLSGTDKTASGITYSGLERDSPKDGIDAPGLPQNIETARFEFVEDTANQTVDTTRAAAGDEWTRGYDNITTFTGGVADLATQDSSGITIPNAGMYSIDVQVDIQIRANQSSTPPGNRLSGESEWGILLRLENSDGTLIDNYAFYATAYAGTFASNATYPIHGIVHARDLPANTKVYLRLFYVRADTGGSDLTSTLSYRVVAPSVDDDRIVVSRFTTTPGSGTGSAVSGDSVKVIYQRASSPPTQPVDGTGSWNGTDYDPPNPWFEDDPSPGSSTPLYIVDVSLSGTDRTSSGITYSGLRRTTPQDGRPGIDGDSSYPLYTRKSGQAPNRPRNLTFDGTNFSGLTQTDGQIWATTYTSGGDPLYEVKVRINGADNSVTVLGDPYRASIPGPIGPFEVTFHQRKSGTAPIHPLNVQYNYDTETYTNLGLWTEDVPVGTDQLYEVKFRVPARETAATVTPTRLGAVYSNKGEPGTDGVGTKGNDGNTPIFVWTQSASQPGVPTTLQFDQSGNLTSNTAGGRTWTTDPATLTGNDPQWITGFYVDTNVNPTTKTPFGTPTPYGRGQPGTNGANGNGQQDIYRLSTTVLSGIPSASGVRLLANRTLDPATLPTGSSLIPPSGTGDVYFSTANIAPDGTIRFTAWALRSAVGPGYQNFYHANTANIVSIPAIGYNGTTFNTVQSGWTTTIPTTPPGANIFTAPVQYRIGISGQTIDGVILSGTVPGTVGPPAGSTSYGLNYGIAVRGTHAIQAQIFTAQNPQPTLTLAPGESGSYNIVLTSTATHLDYYFDIPSGLNFVSAHNTGLGNADDTARWTALDSNNPNRRFRTGFGAGDYHLRLTVMRPN